LAISPVADYTFENLCFQACSPGATTIEPEVSGILDESSPKLEVAGIVSEYEITWDNTAFPTGLITCEYSYFNLVKKDWTVYNQLKTTATTFPFKLTVPFSGNQAVKYRFKFKNAQGVYLQDFTTTVYNTILFNYAEGHTYKLEEAYLTSTNIKNGNIKPTYNVISDSIVSQGLANDVQHHIYKISDPTCNLTPFFSAQPD